MLDAWYYDESSTDGPKALHQFTPNKPVSLETLKKLGVLHWQVDPDAEMHRIDEICAERKYVSRDQVCISRETFGNAFEEKIKGFFIEHIHDDEEIRYVLDGSGFFDIRDRDDKWVRMHTKKGDMIILPAGAYHRFTPDGNEYIKAMRLFKEDPVWTPINRSAETDVHPRRQEYVKQIGAAASRPHEE